MVSAKPEPKLKPIKVVGDSKFYKPGDDTQYDVDAASLTPTSSDYTTLAYRTNAGNRFVFGVSEDVCRGRFTSKKAGDEALTPFFEEFWGNDTQQGFPKMLAEMRMHGLGFAAAAHEGETADDLKLPINHTIGEPLVWYVPETKNMFQSTTTKSPPHLNVLDWSDEWKWWNVPVHKSRLEVLQFYPDESNVLGHSELEKCATALWGLYNLEKGALDRVSVWALLNYIFKIDPTGFKINDKAKYDAIAEAMGQSTWKALDSTDDLIQLSDTAGHGNELKDILFTFLSTGTRIPNLILQGNHAGSLEGAKADLTQYGQYITTIQARSSPFMRRILKKWYGIDVDDLQWNVDYFQSKKDKLEDEIQEQKLEQEKIRTERMKKGEDEETARAQAAGSQAGFMRRVVEVSKEEPPSEKDIEKGKEVPVK